MGPLAAPDLPWQLLTRLGEAQILLPALLLAALGQAYRQRDGLRAGAALAVVGAAAVITTLSKIAFIGFGIGWAPLDFTGISGHAMFAAAVLPLLLRLASGPLAPPAQRAVLLAGYALAAAVGLSRVVVHAHSWSEVASGLALGALASSLVLRQGHWPALRLGRWLPLLLLGWGLAGVLAAPPSRTHDWVTRLSLAVSGRAQPYQRWQLHAEQRLGGGLPAVRAGSLQPR
jgi:membrane-associated phospholipid phosphatase